MGQTTPPATVAQFKAQFVRDFAYGPDLKSVRDSDIQHGLNMADSVFNPALFSTAPVGVPPNATSEALMCYLNAAAHFMVSSIQAVGGLGPVGMGQFSQGEGVTSGKNAGGVGLNMQWPSTITNSPVLYSLTKTTYGIAYLQVLMTKLVGNVGAVAGEVTGLPNVPLF